MNKLAQIQVFSSEWFAAWQPLLLRIVNSPIARIREVVRESLCLTNYDITKSILEIRPDCVIWEHEHGQRIGVFFAGAAMANRFYKAWIAIWRVLHTYDKIINRVFPRLNVGFDTLTVYPDAGNPGVTSVFGCVISNALPAETWIQTLGGVNLTVSQGGLFISGNPIEKVLHRLVSNFDTSPLGPGATISSATALYWHKSNEYNWRTSDTVRLIANTVANANQLTNTDWGRFGTTAQSNSTVTFAEADGYANFIQASWILNSTGLSNINNTSITKFGLRYVANDINSTVANSCYNTVGSPSQTGYEPSLVIIYTPPPSTGNSKQTII